MPRIFDNIALPLLPTLRDTLTISDHADFCVGYFNLRGWKSIAGLVDKWQGGPGNQCRLLVGMQRPPQDELREAYSLLPRDEISNQAVIRLKRKLAEDFRQQLTLGAPSAEDETGLRRLSAQLKAGKLAVKLHTSFPLHAKLYLCFRRRDTNNPATAFLGSSNLTFSGLSKQGELNVDVLDHDATAKLADWFNDRWDDRWCVDITAQLIEILDQSWAGETPVPPHHIYLKIAWHLAEEARAGLSEFNIPPDMRGTLLDFQSAAVRIAARHLEKRGGVILGDVVGLGKTLMATALARMFQEPPHCLETLIVCPKNLVPMWQGYVERWRLFAKVVSVTQVQNQLADLRRYRLAILDESHNLRNREGLRWKALRDYIAHNETKCILLSATPYNKTFDDIASQLRIFLAPDAPLGIRPETYLREQCGGDVSEFTRRHQCAVNSLAAFEKSEAMDDWRELLRLFMVRRTRSFIENNYARTECPACRSVLPPAQAVCPRCARPRAASDRRFLILPDNKRFYFPRRVPRTVPFKMAPSAPSQFLPGMTPADDPFWKTPVTDQYAALYSDAVVSVIAALFLPRYGLALYLEKSAAATATSGQQAIIDNLSRAGKRMLGFCRTGLFKRLESSGHTFTLSLRRHILRNQVHIHALANNLSLPIGTQGNSVFDDGTDEGIDDALLTPADAYNRLLKNHATDFDWLPASLFSPQLQKNLQADVDALSRILKKVGDWQTAGDEKLAALKDLIAASHPGEKILIFSQFADTVHYLGAQLEQRGITRLASVTGDTENITGIVRRFSPASNATDGIDGNEAKLPAADELRVLIATDTLSEGQNLQDAAIIVNYDLPWAIIRLIQRAGRVDRIGQQSEKILCYSFLPAEGIERVIGLRARLRRRLGENAEVIGTDEAFFESENYDQTTRDLYSEKAGALDDETDDDVDLASYAWQIWKNATDADPTLKKSVETLPNVVYSTKPAAATAAIATTAAAADTAPSVITHTRIGDYDALAMLGADGNVLTESQFAILRAAACDAATPALERLPNHHDLVKQAIVNIRQNAVGAAIGGQLGGARSIRRKLYERLKDYESSVKKDMPLFDTRELQRVIDAIYNAPLTENARERISTEMKSSAANEQLLALCAALLEQDRLCVSSDHPAAREPRIICSLGIRQP